MPEVSPILIVGGGLAGLFTALKLSPRPCLVLSPRPLGEGASSAWAQGGIAAAMEEGDTPEAHAADTVAAGAGIVDEVAALSLAGEARARVLDLLGYGVPFDRDLEGHLVQSREAAHSARRIVRVNGDRAGKAIMEALVTAVRATPSIEIREGYLAETLILREGRVEGVLARRVDDGAAPLEAFASPATVLATGGIGALYAVTTNPPEARGLGLAIAAEAGARLADPEFVQFHPTAIDIGRDPAPLATEALRGDGATLLDRDGHRFMLELHPDGELAPRDIVARGVFASLKNGRGAFLDARTAIGDQFPEKFPTVFATCMSAGIDPRTDPIPIAPAEHYHMGGVWTDADGRTSLPGLWAAGEVASTGIHGANRLASNSLLEAVVYGARIAEALSREDLTAGRMAAPVVPAAAAAADASDAHLIPSIRRTMQDLVGVIREDQGLAEAVVTLADLRDRAVSPLVAHMAGAALIVAAAAYLRRESRGGHSRSDFPDTDAALAQRTLLTLREVEEVAATLRAKSTGSRP